MSRGSRAVETNKSSIKIIPLNYPVFKDAWLGGINPLRPGTSPFRGRFRFSQPQDLWSWIGGEL